LIEKYSKENGFTYLGGVSFDKNLEDSIGTPDNLMKTNFMKDFKVVVEKIL
jgi:hypothetical protein